jgi:hypothetical protein
VAIDDFVSPQKVEKTPSLNLVMRRHLLFGPIYQQLRAHNIELWKNAAEGTNRLDVQTGSQRCYTLPCPSVHQDNASRAVCWMASNTLSVCEQSIIRKTSSWPSGFETFTRSRGRAQIVSDFVKYSRSSEKHPLAFSLFDLLEKKGGFYSTSLRTGNEFVNQLF